MYGYILGQWTMAFVSAEWVMACVPKFITDVQCVTILETPQNPQLNAVKV